MKEFKFGTWYPIEQLNSKGDFYRVLACGSCRMGVLEPYLHCDGTVNHEFYNPEHSKYYKAEFWMPLPEYPEGMKTPEGCTPTNVIK